MEEGVVENKRRPKTINLHHRQGSQTRSKQAPVPQGKTVSEDVLFELAKNLMAQVIVDGRAWPCANLSLSVGGFEDGPSGNRGIGGFLVKGEEARALQNNIVTDEGESTSLAAVRPSKKRRLDEGNSRINAFFGRNESTHGSESEPADFDEIPSAQRDNVANDQDAASSTPPTPDQGAVADHDAAASSSPAPAAAELYSEKDIPRNVTHLQQPTVERFLCEQCQRSLPIDQRDEHADWHFARDLQREQQITSTDTSTPAAQTNSAPKSQRGGRGRGRPPRSRVTNGVGRGQSKLAFG